MFSLESLTSDRTRPMVAKCPRCGKPHHYTDLRHPIINDPGYWEVRCVECREILCIPGLHDGGRRSATLQISDAFGDVRVQV